MLSRTADHLYWMSRYIERAESLARLVDAHYQMSLLPHSDQTLAQSLSSTMTALRMEDAFRKRHDAAVRSGRRESARCAPRDLLACGGGRRHGSEPPQRVRAAPGRRVLRLLDRVLLDRWPKHRKAVYRA